VAPALSTGAASANFELTGVDGQEPLKYVPRAFRWQAVDVMRI